MWDHLIFSRPYILDLYVITVYIYETPEQFNRRLPHHHLKPTPLQNSSIISRYGAKKHPPLYATPKNGVSYRVREGNVKNQS